MQAQAGVRRDLLASVVELLVTTVCNGSVEKFMATTNGSHLSLVANMAAVYV